MVLLATAGYSVGCTAVVLKKLELEAKQTVATVTAGMAVGSLLLLAMYPLGFFE